jgi:tetratricopeptide (TPR) repeat protein
MRVFVVWTIIFIGCVAPAFSVPSKPEPAAGAVTIDQLFATLAKPGDEAAGEAAAAEIQRRWQKSGSDTVDLLMGWAGQSVAAKDYGRALDFLDAVVTLKPDFAEGWNRRASVFYLRDDYGKALADLEKVLALEPRHFTALASLGLILRDIDRNKEALLALQKALDLDPYLDEDVQDAIKELKPAVEGREI